MCGRSLVCGVVMRLSVLLLFGFHVMFKAFVAGTEVLHQYRVLEVKKKKKLHFEKFVCYIFSHLVFIPNVTVTDLLKMKKKTQAGL